MLRFSINRYSIAAKLLFLVIATVFLQAFEIDIVFFSQSISNILIILLAIYTIINMFVFDLGVGKVKLVVGHILYISLIIVIGLPFVLYPESRFEGLMKLYSSLFLLLSIVYWNRDIRVLKGIWNGIIILGIITVFGATLQLVFGFSHIIPVTKQATTRLSSLGIPRATGFITSFGHYGSIIETATLLMLTGYFVRINSMFVSKIFAYLAIPMAILGLVFSQSRSGLLATVISLWVFIILVQKKQKGLLGNVFKLIVYVLPIVALFLGKELVKDLYEVNILTVNNRIDVFLYAIKIFTKYPLIGSGLGSVENYFNLSHPVHNGFLNILVAYGLLGFTGFISLYYISLKAGIEALKRNLNERLVSIGLISALIAVIIEMNLYPSFSDPIIYILCGLLLSLRNFNFISKIKFQYD